MLFKKKLSYGLGVPVVPISVLKREGLGKITEMIIQATYKKLPTPLSCTYDDRLEAALHEIEDVLDNSVPVFKRWYAIKLFERDPEISKGLKISAKQLKEVEQLIFRPSFLTTSIIFNPTMTGIPKSSSCEVK